MTAEQKEKVAYKAYPLSFCAGVRYSIEGTKKTLEQHPEVYVYGGRIVNNTLVVEDLERRGAIPVDTIEEIPEGSVAMITAHGASDEERQKLRERKLKIVDVTCPLVERVHDRAKRFVQKALDRGEEAEVLYICKDPEHREPKALIGEIPNNIRLIRSLEDAESFSPKSGVLYSVDTQTTLNNVKAEKWVDILRQKIPDLKIPPRGDVCYATYNRQGALTKVFGLGPEMAITFGSTFSSNTTELVKLGRSFGVPVYLKERATDITRDLIEGYRTIAVTAGASAPPEEPDKCMEMLKEWGYKVEVVRFAEEPENFKNAFPKIEDHRLGAR